MADSAALFMGTINGLFATMDGSVEKLTNDGRVLAGLLLVIRISWEGIQVAIMGKSINEALARLINLAIVAGVVALLLAGQITDPINRSFDSIAQTISGGDTALGSAVSSITKTVLTIWQGGMAKQAGAAAGSTTWEQIRNWFDSLSMGGLAQMLIEYIMSAFITLAIAICGALYVAMYLVTQILIKLALILMPVMVPWMLHPRTEFLFDGWLRFFLSAGMQKVVGAFFFAASYKMLEGAATIAANTTSTGEALGAYVLVLILTVVIAWLMLQIPQIAAGLINGNGGHGGGVWEQTAGAVKKLGSTQKGGGK